MKCGCRKIYNRKNSGHAEFPEWEPGMQYHIAAEGKDMRRKTILIAITVCCIVLCITVLLMKEKDGQSSENDILPEQTSFFFPEDENALQYSLETTLQDGLPKETQLLLTRVAVGSEGVLYHIKIDIDMEFAARYCYGWDRFDLGYFYVTDTAVYRIENEETATAFREEELQKVGTIVCQKTGKEDPVEGQEGWHEYIEVQDNICEFHGYNDLTETGFYEAFIWEDGKGLIEYRSGFGAMRDGISLERI